MRVTNKMLSNSFLRDMRYNLDNMKTIQQQMSSGKEIRRPSDNPFKVARAMQLHTDINANKQYNENISDTLNWLDTTDTALSQAGDVLQRVRELMISSGNAAYSSSERRAIKDEVNEKIGEFTQIMNTSFDGKYIFAGNRGTSKPLDTKAFGDNNEIVYNGKNGINLPSPVSVKVDENNINGNWAGKVISFDIGGASNLLTVGSGVNDIDSLVNDINSTLLNNGSLNGKVQATKSILNGGTYINFTSLTDETIEIKQDSPSTFPVELASFKDSKLGDNQINMINSKLNVEISQGVTMEYNVTAGEVLEYKNPQGTHSSLKELFNAIVTHLDGNEYNTEDARFAGDSRYNDTAGVDATEALTGKDLQGITEAIDNLLKIRSEVGAKQNRMESALNKNEEENFNLTEILSKTEDIDITEKTMEYATMQTVYLAALQTSARVLQPSLLDYLR